MNEDFNAWNKNKRAWWLFIPCHCISEFGLCLHRDPTRKRHTHKLDHRVNPLSWLDDDLDGWIVCVLLLNNIISPFADAWLCWMHYQLRMWMLDMTIEGNIYKNVVIAYCAAHTTPVGHIIHALFCYIRFLHNRSTCTCVCMYLS